MTRPPAWQTFVNGPWMHLDARDALAPRTQVAKAGGLKYEYTVAMSSEFRLEVPLWPKPSRA